MNGDCEGEALKVGDRVIIAGTVVSANDGNVNVRPVGCSDIDATWSVCVPAKSVKRSELPPRVVEEPL